jgi:prenyltransferase beta subunit
MLESLKKPAKNSKDELSQIAEQSIAYLLSLWDSQSGGFRFTANRPATLMSTSYGVLGLEFTQGLSQLDSEQKTATISFLKSGFQPDGSFCDPLFHPEDILSQEHDLAYFQQETTTMCQQALDALAATAPPRDWQLDWRTANGIVSYLESLPWRNAWLDSNPVMFLLSQLCHDVDRHGQTELLQIVDTALDWLDAHQSPQTGLWQGPHEVSLTNAMAATFHFTFYYGYRRRPLHYADRIIDSCLELQETHGLFSGRTVGQTCLDYDALDLLAKASLTTNYRTEEVQKAMRRAYDALLRLHNPDGGFADCKEIRVAASKGRKAKLLSKLGLSSLVKSFTFIPATGTYNVCWKLLSCDMADSNAFSTWFRLLSLHLATQGDWLNSSESGSFTFRRLPFLGYHDVLAIKSSQINNKSITV